MKNIKRIALILLAIGSIVLFVCLARKFKQDHKLLKEAQTQSLEIMVGDYYEVHKNLYPLSYQRSPVLVKSEDVEKIMENKSVLRCSPAGVLIEVDSLLFFVMSPTLDNNRFYRTDWPIFMGEKIDSAGKHYAVFDYGISLLESEIKIAVRIVVLVALLLSIIWCTFLVCKGP